MQEIQNPRNYSFMKNKNNKTIIAFQKSPQHPETYTHIIG